MSFVLLLLHKCHIISAVRPVSGVHVMRWHCGYNQTSSCSKGDWFWRRCVHACAPELSAHSKNIKLLFTPLSMDDNYHSCYPINMVFWGTSVLVSPTHPPTNGGHMECDFLWTTFITLVKTLTWQQILCHLTCNSMVRAWSWTNKAFSRKRASHNPLAMAIYVTAIRPLIDSEEQCNAKLHGLQMTLLLHADFKEWCENLSTWGADYGYFPNILKSVIVVLFWKSYQHLRPVDQML